jgi:hypothetical protein
VDTRDSFPVDKATRVLSLPHAFMAYTGTALLCKSELLL